MEFTFRPISGQNLSVKKHMILFDFAHFSRAPVTVEDLVINSGIIFLIFPYKHMLWVLIRSISVGCFFEYIQLMFSWRTGEIIAELSSNTPTSEVLCLGSLSRMAHSQRQILSLLYSFYPIQFIYTVSSIVFNIDFTPHIFRFIHPTK